uniref:Uncharacterized protein n=1 Tax=Tolypothrix bouteillei VB521301 TaxID=1479485 RepID=A0A0C1R254_9CYAN
MNHNISLKKPLDFPARVLEKARRVFLRPLVEQIDFNLVQESDNYNLDKEPYFYGVNDSNLKSVQEQLTERKKAGFNSC